MSLNETTRAMEWREVGPHRGGRVVAVAGHPTEPATFYFGACAGGIWKTTDGGTYWENISDGFFKTAAVGALAVSASDPNVIYAGMGETAIRGNVSHGDGVYKSTDGGQTWKNVGLQETQAIGRVRIHPTNPDLVYVAALGHVWGPNKERGVYRSKDGGQTWEQVLFRSEKAGAIDLSMDPNNPRILYATTWEAQRYPYKLVSGGDGSGIFKSTDGGDSWTELTRNPGLPTGVLGKIGIAASGAQANRVYAIVEAEDGALFRSDDGGATWQRLSEQGDLRWRAWYYQHIYADPRDANTVWVLNGGCWKSIDGGKNFSAVPTPHGDNHDLWIDPNNTQRMIEGNDGGANVTFNGGLSWSSIFNQPTAQLYHITTDNQVPYRLYGSQQDNTAVCIPSASAYGAITESDWFQPGGGESGYIAVKPSDPNIIVGGAIGSGAGNGRLIRYDHRTKEQRIITPWPEMTGMGYGAKDLKYRFQWTFPILYSPHDPDTLYVTSNVVHRSTDEGMSWTVISPDLTRNDPATQDASGGPITKDNTGAEVYGTIFAFVESPHQQGLFWAGSDDGRVHISKDSGQSWQEITPPDLPKHAMISIIEASPHEGATAYVAATCYKTDDFAPYLYKTSDYGQSWTKIVGGLPAEAITRTIREDPSRQGLLYCGTETGLFVSLDDGANWDAWQLNLPVVPLHDLAIKGSDLIAATHGRSFWILDDLSPIRQLTDEVRNTDAYLFKPRPANRFKNYGRYGENLAPYKSYGRVGGMMMTHYTRQRRTGENEYVFLDAGKNPPDGAIIYYHLKSKPEDEVKLTFLTQDGSEIVSYGSKATKGMHPTADAGLNRFVWDMRYPSAHELAESKVNGGQLAGPVVVPGQYQVRLTVGDDSLTQPLEIVRDPRVSGSQADLQAQFDLLLKLRDALSETHDAVAKLRELRQQLEGWTKRSDNDEVKNAAQAIIEMLNALELELVQPKAGSPLQPPAGLDEKIAALTGMIANADTRPTAQSSEVYDKLAGLVDAAIEKLDPIIGYDIARFNELLTKHGAQPVSA